MNERSSTVPAAPNAARSRPNEPTILDAALQAFAEQGFNGASMRDIARGAGTSLSNLYNYFPSKADLLAELLHRANQEQLERTQEAVHAAQPSARARMREAVRAFVGFVVDHQLASLVAISEFRYLSGPQRDHVVAARDATQAIFETVVADGVDSGEFRTPYPGDAARNIVTMCSAISTWYHTAGRLSAQQLAEQHAHYALALLEAQ